VKPPPTRPARFGGAASRTQAPPTSLPDALIRLAEAEDTFRAIGEGEVDAFLQSDGAGGQRVFTLTSADRPYRMFVESMRDGAATISSSGLILYVNSRLAELLLCSKETIVGARLSRFVAGGISITSEKIQGPGGLGATAECDLVDGDGGLVPVLVGSAPLYVDGDRLTCLTFTDLSTQKEQDREISRLSEAQADQVADLQDAQAALTQQATHDALTGLPNRGLLVDRIEQVLAHAKRSGRCTAVMFVDLDRFKQVNDTQGHAAGDAVLQQMADSLSGFVRPMDTVARLGGDEFVVLAPELASHMAAGDLGARLISDLARRSDEAQGSDAVTASIGIAVSERGRGTAEKLLKEADTAMYKAKSLGGARAEVFDTALGRQVQQRAAAKRMLQTAMDESRVLVHYQPVIDLHTGNVSGVEALARITKLDGSLLQPAGFIPLAEDSGLVVPLGARVLEMACREVRAWQPRSFPDSVCNVAVNLSARQFQTGGLPLVVRQTLERTGLDPMCLHLELTETAVLDLNPDILEQLGLIRDLGVQLGLDDFGTGYASLTHLRRLPLTFVKIDRSFVSGIGPGRDDERIVSAVVDLAANLGLRSIAEGVERKQQLDLLRELGCDQAQGFLFARALPPEEIPALIQHEAW
jgi:diguanylate cyclase (GGDEF)-like protein